MVLTEIKNFPAKQTFSWKIVSILKIPKQRNAFWVECEMAHGSSQKVVSPVSRFFVFHLFSPFIDLLSYAL